MDVPASGVAGTIFALLQPVGPEGLGRSALLRRQIIQELQGRVPNSGESTGRGASTGVNGELDQGEIAPLPQMAVDGLKDARPPDFRGLGILVAFVSPGMMWAKSATRTLSGKTFLRAASKPPAWSP